MVAMAFILIHRLFTLQIVNGEDYVKNFNLKTTKTRTVKSTRGNIYDCNGNVLASNELSYSITLEDNGSYDTTKERNLSLNGEIFRIMKIVEEQGDFMTSDFRITLDENGNFIFDAEGVTLSRFRADVYGRAKIEQMTAAEKASSADKIMNDLAVRFCIFEYNDKPYTPDELSKYGLPENITKSQQLTITIVRYLLHNTSYQKYMPVTVASNVSDKTVAAILENQSLLQGIGIEEDTRRVYTDSVYFASIIGYTGKPSSEELEELSEISDEYNTTSIIGKAGIEQYMETTLQGKEGSETVKVDSLGKVLEIDESSRKIPQQGNDVYLTIDKELQIAAYKILEQRIAGILIKNITNIKDS